MIVNNVYERVCTDVRFSQLATFRLRINKILRTDSYLPEDGGARRHSLHPIQTEPRRHRENHPRGIPPGSPRQTPQKPAGNLQGTDDQEAERAYIRMVKNIDAKMYFSNGLGHALIHLAVYCLIS